MIQIDSAKRWAQRLRVCCAARVATTVQIDIDTENNQQKTGPPSTSRLRKVVILLVKAISDLARGAEQQRSDQHGANIHSAQLNTKQQGSSSVDNE
jgi:hypothetical protein